jgi:transcription termination factor Rho
MHNGQVEGILQITDERQDGHLRDVQHPLRPVRGNILVPRQVIRELQLRPGLLLSGSPRGRHLNRIDKIEGLHPDEYASKIHLYEGTALDPEPMTLQESSSTLLMTALPVSRKPLAPLLVTESLMNCTLDTL